MTHTDTEELAVEVRDLRKSYGEMEAVRGVSFEVFRGEVLCLLWTQRRRQDHNR